MLHSTAGHQFDELKEPPALSLPTMTAEDFAECDCASVPVIPAPTSKTLFEYIATLKSNTLASFCNDVQDQLFDFSTVDVESKEQLTSLLNTYSDDTQFNELVLKIYDQAMNTFELKQLLSQLSSFPKISLQSATLVLTNIFTHLADLSVVPSESYVKLQHFILYLLTSPFTPTSQLQQSSTKLEATTMHLEHTSHNTSQPTSRHV